MSLVFLGLSAVTTIVGDMNAIWLCLFLSFFVPSMLMKDESKSAHQAADIQQKDSSDGNVKLTERGSIIVSKVKALFEKLDSKIPKFSNW